jgi:GAF domain-containing protein
MILETNLARTFAALSATNEAILYAKSPEELYEQVCQAAFSNGDYLATAIFLLEPASGMLRFAAGFGEDIARLCRIDISTAADTPEGSGVCGQAFRDQRLSICNDYLNDARSLAWRQGACDAHIGAAAALPLTCHGRSVGVLLVTLREAGSLTGEVVSLLERMSANISYALDNFDREAARKSGEHAMRRLNRMFGALSATNEAILRAKTVQDLYQLVCDAAVRSGETVAAVILLAEPDSNWLKPVAGTGEIVELVARTRFSIDPDNAYGNGVCSHAFRTRKPCINNDVQNSAQGQPWLEAGREGGVTACAALPLLKAGISVGVLLFFIGKSSVADQEIIALLARIAENVSFALDNFDRAEEKAKADEQKERLGHMFAALSATNEAIMRAGSRAELFELACQAATNSGKFTSTTIGLVRPGKDFLDIVATAGPTAEATKKVRLSVMEHRPEGRGISGIAFRSRKPCISNDYLTDPRGTAFHQSIRNDGARAVAAFPLFSGSRPAGILLFCASEKDAFTPGSVDLLQRLADNISFAIRNFDLADEKAKADKQKDRLTRMFEALSATNEAIMRAKSRAELFELVCEAAVLGGTFTSTTIVLAGPGETFLRIATSKGKNHERVRSTRFAISPDHPEGRGLIGTAFRTKAPCITNDFLANEKTMHWHALAGEGGTRSGAGFPLLKKGSEAIGVLLFLAGEEDVFTADLVELLAKLAENVSFALDNFDRADEKTKADERIEYLASHDSLTNLPNREMFNGLLH